MSFSSDVKDELCECLSSSQAEKSCMYGMLFFSSLNKGVFSLKTENARAAELFSASCRKFTECKVDTQERAAKKGTLFTVRVTPNAAERERLFAEAEKFRTQGIAFIEETGLETGAFTGGAFIVAGSITDPEKDYHLEITSRDEETANRLRELFSACGIQSGIVARTSKYVVYMKGSEAIEDTMTLMGAVHSTIGLMNVKILKDVRNKANRIANCDNANIERTLRASEKQIRDIQYIYDTVGFDELSPELYDMAMVRLENPDVSLSELGSMLEKPIGRSGVNHRLRRLCEIAEEIREERSAK